MDENDDDININSIIIGGHNSPILASSYNSPKKLTQKNKSTKPKVAHLSPYHQKQFELKVNSFIK